jgi:hypothetical protein
MSCWKHPVQNKHRADDKQDPAMRDDMVKLLVERTTAINNAGLMEQQHSNTPIIQ